MSNDRSEPTFDPWTPQRRRNKGRDCCPVCFRPYELIDNELLQTCFCPQNSNICGRHGLNNHGCGS